MSVCIELALDILGGISPRRVRVQGSVVRISGPVVAKGKNRFLLSSAVDQTIQIFSGG